MNRMLPLLLTLSAAALLLAGCGGGEPDDTAAAGPPSADIKAMFGTMPREMTSPDNPITPEKVALGRMLYYDDRMSLSGDISCNSCHILDEFGDDGLDVSPGHDGSMGTRNSPTVYNAALQFAQFWDGREPTVEAQALGPIMNPVEHGMPDEAAVEELLRGVPEYRPYFQAAFPGEDEPVTIANVGKAIGAFERKLVTRGTWDRWLMGDGNALNVQQKRGLDAFIDTGCTTCHMGPNLGGSMFQKMGLIKPYETDDLGRYDVTGQDQDKYFFKVPLLRNVAETDPYLHDGSIETLEETVRIMAEHQLGKTVTEQQVADMVAFMKALTGKIDEEYIAKPELPGYES